MATNCYAYIAMVVPNVNTNIMVSIPIPILRVLSVQMAIIIARVGMSIDGNVNLREGW